MMRFGKAAALWGAVAVMGAPAVAENLPGDFCEEEGVYDCAGNCIDLVQAEEWSGDGYCDDGEWGVVLTCPAFDNDGGDCEVFSATPPGSPCGDGLLYDCAGSCVEAALAFSWVGDGYCDDGAWDLVLTCPAFDDDGGDCDPLPEEELVPDTLGLD